MNLFAGLGNQLPSDRLVTCAANGDVAGLKKAMDDGASPNYRRSDMTPILLALSRGHEACANALLDQDKEVVNVNSKNNQGWRPLHQAVLNNMPEMISRLITHGGIVSLKDDLGRAPLHIAAAENRLAIAGQLLDADAAIDSPTVEGVTPLMVAVEKRNAPMLTMLLERGANPALLDKAGVSAVDRAAGWSAGQEAFQHVVQAQQEVVDLLNAAKAQEAGISSIAKRRRPS